MLIWRPRSRSISIAQLIIITAAIVILRLRGRQMSITIGLEFLDFLNSLLLTVSLLHLN